MWRVGVPIAVWETSVDLGQSLVQEIDTEVAPNLGWLPWFDGLNLIAIGIKVSGIAIFFPFFFLSELPAGAADRAQDVS